MLPHVALLVGLVVSVFFFLGGGTEKGENYKVPGKLLQNEKQKNKKA